MVFSRVILGSNVSKEGKPLNPMQRKYMHVPQNSLQFQVFNGMA
jgi:hypothetical protein